MAFDKQLNFIISAVDKATWPIKWVSKSLGWLNQSIKNMQPAFQNMATYWWVAMWALLAWANQTIKQASNLNESINAVNVVFKESSQTILDFWKNAAKSVWLSKSAFNQLATPIWAMLSNMKYWADEAATATIELTKRAADMASVFNTDVNTAMQAIQAGIRWEIDPLEKYWVSLSDASIKAYALSQWLIETNREMTNEEKTRARVALLMEQTNKLAWDFINTSWEEANASRILNAEIENMSATIGTQLLPIKKQLLQTVWPIVEKLSEWIQKNPELTKNLIIWAVAVTWLVTVLWTLWLAIPTIIAWFTSLIAWLTAVKFAFIAVWWPITILIALIAALAVATYTNWDKIKQWFKDWTEAVWIYMDVLNTKSETHWMKMKQWASDWTTALYRYWEALKTNLETVMINIQNWLSTAWNNIVETAKSYIAPLVDWISSKFDAVVSFVNKIKSALSSVWWAISWWSSTEVAWARANGWPVWANKTYLVWERWPELFTPWSSGKITPNNELWWWKQVSLTIWSINVSNEADENRLVQKIKEMLIRDDQLYNYWVL